MSRKLWGQSEGDTPNVSEKIVPVIVKHIQLEEAENNSSRTSENPISVRIKSRLITQTIEVMKQTEMLRSLIDTYSNKSGSSNYLLNPCQMIPEIDFPPENVAEFAHDEKFKKPFWFIPPIETRFSCGLPESLPLINRQVCRDSLRKVLCGQLRVAGFIDSAESALLLFIDSIDEFLRNVMEQVGIIHINKCKDANRPVDITTVEKAHRFISNRSLTDVHNFFKHNLFDRNRTEILEFKDVLQEYDRLMKDSQCMQREEFNESDFLNILEMPTNSIEETIGNNITDFNSSKSNSLLTMFE